MKEQRRIAGVSGDGISLKMLEFVIISQLNAKAGGKEGKDLGNLHCSVPEKRQ